MQQLMSSFAAMLAGLADNGGYWPLVGLEMLFGVLWALDFPARRTALFSLVGGERGGEHLDAVIERVGHVHLAARIHRHDGLH